MSSTTPEQFKDQAEQNKDNLVAHEFFAFVKARQMAQEAIKAWGKCLNNPRSAPNFVEIEPALNELDDTGADLDIVINHRGAGVCRMKPSDKQTELFAEIRTELARAASAAGIGQNEIDAASAAFEQAFAPLSYHASFADKEAALAMSSLIDAKHEAIEGLAYKDSGREIKLESLHQVAKYLPPRPEHDPAPESEAQEQQAEPKARKYSSLGQMVKEGAAAELEEYIVAAIDAGAWHDQAQEQANKLVWHAASMGQLECLKVLIEKANAQVTEQDTNGLTPLLAACASDKPEVIEYLLSKGASLDEKSVDGLTPLMIAASHNAANCVRKLVEVGVDINETSLDGRTALHAAALGVEDKSGPDAIAALIELGADPSIRDHMSDAYPEEYVDEESDDAYSKLVDYRKKWEAGAVAPQKQSVVSKARSILGF